QPSGRHHRTNSSHRGIRRAVPEPASNVCPAGSVWIVSWNTSGVPKVSGVAIRSRMGRTEGCDVHEFTQALGSESFAEGRPVLLPPLGKPIVHEPQLAEPVVVGVCSNPRR